MLTLYGGSSPNVRKVSILLEELGLPHDYRQLNISGGELDTPEFARLNPMRKVPVLVDPQGPDGAPCTVFESGAILIYLAEKTGRFLPASGAARYVVLEWLMVQMAAVGPAFGQFTHFRRFAPGGEGGHDYALSRYETQVVTLFEVMDARLGEADFLGGAAYSIADMATWPWIANRQNAWGVSIAGFANVQRWFEAVAARPAVQRMLAAYLGIERRATGELLGATADDIDRFMGRGPYARSWPSAAASDGGNLYDAIEGRAKKP